MKKTRILSFLLAMCLLLSLAACSKKSSLDSIEDAKAAIEAGNYEEAYRYLLTEGSDEATALLKNFAFVPVKVTYTDARIETDPIISTYTNTYDEKGNLLSVVRQEQDGTTSFPLTCTYDENGKLLRIDETKFNQTTTFTDTDNGFAVHVEEYRYDPNNEYSFGPDYDYNRYTFLDVQNHLRISLECAADEPMPTIEKTQNDKGDLLSLTAVFADGSRASLTYTYDEAGNRLSEKKTDRNGREVRTITYDKYGNVLLECYEDGRAEHIYTLDDQNRILVDEYESYAPADAEKGVEETRRTGKTTYTYDDNGNILKRTRTGYWGNFIFINQLSVADGDYIETNTYDEQGRLVRRIIDYTDTISANLRGDDPADYRNVYTEECTYDGEACTSITKNESGNIVKKVYTSSDRHEIWYGKMAFAGQWWYDENGEHVQRTEDEWVLSSQFSYVYDEFGNTIEQTDQGTNNTKTTYELKYYPNGVPLVYEYYGWSSFSLPHAIDYYNNFPIVVDF